MQGFVRIGATFALVGGLVLSGLLGSSLLVFSLAGQLIHYGLSARRGDRSGVRRAWSATAAAAVLTLLIGVTPATLVVSVAFFSLAALLTAHELDRWAMNHDARREGATR